MRIIPVVSKQIDYVEYDEQSSKMFVKYHTGQILAFADIKPDECEMIISSDNRYDLLMKMTAERLPQSS